MHKTYRDAWHGYSVIEILSDITANEAASLPLEGRHTIWELVQHMKTWKRVVRMELMGKEFEKVKPEQAA